MTTTITLEVVGAVRIPTADELLGPPARRYADAVMLAGVNHLSTVAPVDRGGLRNSLQPGVTLTRVDAAGALPTAVTWGTNLGYGDALNEGKRRGPGKAPPVAEIERWIKRRGIAPTRTAKTGRVTKDRRGTRSMAFAIARKIAKEGTSTGPAYVGGPKKDAETRGWFEGLRAFVAADAERRIADLARDIQERWNALTR